MSTRNSISLALAVFVLVLAAARPLHAQQLFTAPPRAHGEVVVQAAERGRQDVPPDTANGFTKKSGAVALAFAYLVPGGGQIYSEKYGKGIALLGVSVGSAALASASCSSLAESETCVGNSLLAMVAVLGAWGYGLASAPGDAREYNEKHARTIALQPVLDRNAGRAGLGVALRF